MKKIFLPDKTKQNGVFKYLFDRFGENVKNYIEIHGNSYKDCSVFDIIDDSHSGRYSSDTGAPTNFYIVFRKFGVIITHYAMSHYNGFCFSREWNIYDETKSECTLISKGNFSQCGTGTTCVGNQIQIHEVSSTSLIRSFKYDQIGKRSCGDNYIEFHSMEIYGTLIFDDSCVKTYPRGFHIRFNLLYCVLLSY